MLLDFIGFISDNVALSTDQKLALLEDFCDQYNYEEIVEDEEGNEIPNPESRRHFANRQITRFLRESVNATRRQRAADAAKYEELELEVANAKT